MFEYLKKDNHDFSEKEDNKSGQLEKLISSGARYIDKTLKIITLTTAITAATLLPGCSSESSEKTEITASLKSSSI